MKSNILGDIRAENDIFMLDQAFLETPDYKSLLESSDRCVIVGRRGTGKSALVHKLDQYWSAQKKIAVLNISPEEDQIIGLRGVFNAFGNNFMHIKAGSKIAWRYALYMEIVSELNNHYKLKHLIERFELETKLRSWGNFHHNISTKLRNVLQKVIDRELSPETNIADLSSKLDIEGIENGLFNIFRESPKDIVLLIDRLDEGYTPDNLGVALVDGFVQAVIDLNSKFKNYVRGIVFLRDNMYRSMSINDYDFTRNIEGQVLRLHWDEYALFNMVCNRLRVAYNNKQENNARLWDVYTARELKGREGFRDALRLTLYRPRDILVLLNNAFLHAAGQSRKEIILDDINYSAKSISENRLSDLEKEYESIFPALRLFTSSFASGAAKISISYAQERINRILAKDNHEIQLQRDLVIFKDSNQVLQRLYGIGFLGIHDETSGAFVFCHDGRDPAKHIAENSEMLIHPCYWLALNLIDNQLERDQAENIYDEYDIKVSSISEEQRKTRIGQMLEEIKSIKQGKDDCYTYEGWCLQTLKLIFAGVLSNFEIHPNKNGRQQRDIVATNMALTPVWSRILKDYDTRQVIFEIKNYETLAADDYRQMNAYLSNDYGRLGFIISRAKDNNLQKGLELDWAQEIFFNHQKKIIIKLSAHYLEKNLSKLRNPQKHDAADTELNKLLDIYTRQYLILKKT